MPHEALASASSPSTLVTAVGPETSSSQFLGASMASSWLSVVALLAPGGAPFEDGGGVGDLSRIFSLSWDSSEGSCVWPLLLLAFLAP